MAIYTVSQVTTYVNEVLSYDEVLRDVWVEGEVANVAKPASGHAYFTLRDGTSSLRCVMFRNSRGMEHLLDGAAIIAHGRLAVYEVRGDLQLIADIAQPEGAGELQLRLEQLKLKLEQEGLFEPSRKRPVPEFPRRVGVITSPSGAVWQDIQTVIARRYPLVELALAPTAVQGDTAAAGIVEAFLAMNAEPDIDVVIIARGGGSMEDLWPFNEEAVARAVFASQAPVISAVGHETDFTICDLVADLRAPTPSAAAELAVPDLADLALRVLSGRRALDDRVSDIFRRSSESLDRLDLRLDRGRPRLDTLRMRVDDLLRAAASQMSTRVQVTQERLEGTRLRLESLSPLDTLRRGYAIVQLDPSGDVIIDAAQTSPGDDVRVTVNQGAFGATVSDTAPSDGESAS
jgi:exodeoxyribonuclease VII large subunit